MVISVPIDLDRRPNYFTRSGNSFKKYCPEFPKNWMHTGSYDHMISVSVKLIYLKQWDPLYQSKTSTQPIESRQETPAMAVRGQSYVDSLGGCQRIML